ncbi:MAG: CAP domain-containing protein [Alphaproteobacteria bacterium]
MRLVALLCAAALAAGCASEPGETWDFSSHYFKQSPPVEEEETPRAPAPAPVEPVAVQRLEKATPAPHPMPEETAPVQPRAGGFSSHYFKAPLTRAEVIAQLETRVLAKVINERRRIDPKAKPLTLDPQLTEVARRHSQDMASKNYVAHANADGETTTTRLMDTDAKFRGLLGENIASQSYDGVSRIDLDEYAQRLVDTWLNSTDHKANLAYALYERTGVGVAVNSHTIYVTQLFATDLGLPEPDLSSLPRAAKPSATSGQAGGS